MIPASRDEFQEFCFRALGHPVIQINVDDDQVEDRIDEALYTYQQFHMDAVAKTYRKHQVTASTMNVGSIVGTFDVNENFRGGTSNAAGVITSANSTVIGFYTTNGTDFADGETITGLHSGATAVLAANAAVTKGDMDNRYITIPNSIIAITRVLHPYDGFVPSDILFDTTAQFNMSLIANFTSNSIIPYVMGRQYQQLLSDTFRGRPQIRYERHQNRLYIDTNWLKQVRPGQYFLIECMTVIDPDTYTDVWSDRWLQRYAIALIKRQWGMNLSKYTGVALPGNVTLDGRSMLTEANQEVKDLEEELKNTYQLPIDFMVGGILLGCIGLHGWLNTLSWIMPTSIFS